MHIVIDDSFQLLPPFDLPQHLIVNLRGDSRTESLPGWRIFFTVVIDACHDSVDGCCSFNIARIFASNALSSLHVMRKDTSPRAVFFVAAHSAAFSLRRVSAERHDASLKTHQLVDRFRGINNND